MPNTRFSSSQSVCTRRAQRFSGSTNFDRVSKCCSCSAESSNELHLPLFSESLGQGSSQTCAVHFHADQSVWMQQCCSQGTMD